MTLSWRVWVRPVLALLIDGDCIEFAHIGDSRAYRLRPGADGEFEQISTDHTFVQRLLNEGRITPQEAENHPHKNVIMRACDRACSILLEKLGEI